MLDAGDEQASDKDTTAIARRNIALHLSDGTFSRYISNHDAWARIEAQEAFRIGEKSIQLHPAKTTIGKVTWAPKQSGYAGPLVLQVVT